MTYSLWHRRDHRPRPVLVVQELAKKVRVVDLVESTPHRSTRFSTTSALGAIPGSGRYGMRTGSAISPIPRGIAP
jgi:hypothetical protein